MDGYFSLYRHRLGLAGTSGAPIRQNEREQQQPTAATLPRFYRSDSESLDDGSLYEGSLDDGSLYECSLYEGSLTDGAVYEEESGISCLGVCVSAGA
jgi:hypothetical protein